MIHGFAQCRVERGCLAGSCNFLRTPLHRQLNNIHMSLRTEGYAGMRGLAQDQADPFHSLLGVRP